MDEVQIKIAKALKENRNCLKDATLLKNVLADAIPNDKIHSNLILGAYNEGIFKCFFEKDPTLSLLQFIPMLVNDYGISEENAVWSVVTWCYVFSRVETAEAIMNLGIGKSTASSANSTSTGGGGNISSNNTGTIGMGMYKAGVDVPIGTLRIKIQIADNVKPKDIPSIFYGVGKNPDEVHDGKEVENQFYVELEDGDYLLLRKYGDAPLKSVTYEKV